MAEAEAQSNSLNAEELLELLRSDGDQDDCQAGVVSNKVGLYDACQNMITYLCLHPDDCGAEQLKFRPGPGHLSCMHHVMQQLAKELPD